MKEPQWSVATEEEVWKFVAWHLAKNGIETILVGGAVAAIYSEGIYKSGDLDEVEFKLNDPRDSVHEFYNAAIEAGAKDNGPPGRRPKYTPNYYACFVFDPDKLIIETVHDK